MWIFYSLLANISAITLEFLYRIHYFPTFWGGLYLILPLALITAWGLYHSFWLAPQYLLAWAVFFAANAILRILVNIFFLQEPFSVSIVIGILLLALGVFLIKI